MVKINGYLSNLNNKNSFYDISNIVSSYKKNNPDKIVLSLSIGDVSKPIVKPIIEAMHEAVDDLSDMATFKGYGGSSGYDFLKKAILDNEYKKYNFSLDEIFISNGTKTDSSNILELFDINSNILISNPLYPIYKDGASCLSRNVTLMETGDDFLPIIPKEKYDIIYLCSPNNPTGLCYTYDELNKWVKYAIKNNSVIIYDNVYSSFIRSKDAIKSIYEIEGSKSVAIELKSFSKNASFTGVRCSYYIIPKEISDGVNDLWKRRTINRFNGADYIAQKGAYASYSKEAQKLIKKNIDYYLDNAKYLRNSFSDMGFEFYGGIDSPYLWVKIKEDMNSLEYFKFMLEKLHIVIVPGIIFGDKGDKFFRVSALAPKEIIVKSIERMKKYYEKK